MKKLAFTILLALTGCVQQESPVGSIPLQTAKPVAVVEKDHVKLDQFPDYKIQYDLEFDWQHKLAAKYGSIAFKAIDLCSEKHDWKLTDDLDTSSEQGSLVLREYLASVQDCSINSLEPYTIQSEASQEEYLNSLLSE